MKIKKIYSINLAKKLFFSYIYRLILIGRCLMISKTKKILSLTFSGVLFFILAFGTPLQANEDIRGAFGISFGDFFDPSKALSKDKFSGNIVYEFAPQEKPKFFDQHYLSITPKTNKVFAICGVNKASDLEKAKENYKMILERMEKKYGKVESGFLSGLMNMFGLKRIEQGDRKVLISFKENSMKTYVIYYDTNLKRQAKQEEKKEQNNYSTSIG